MEPPYCDILFSLMPPVNQSQHDTFSTASLSLLTTLFLCPFQPYLLQCIVSRLINETFCAHSLSLSDPLPSVFSYKSNFFISPLPQTHHAICLLWNVTLVTSIPKDSWLFGSPLYQAPSCSRYPQCSVSTSALVSPCMCLRKHTFHHYSFQHDQNISVSG